MLNVEHRHCLRHLYNNFRLKHKGLALKILKFDARKATRECDFDKFIDRMKSVDEGVYQWCKSRNPAHWSRAFFKSQTVKLIIC